MRTKRDGRKGNQARKPSIYFSGPQQRLQNDQDRALYDAVFQNDLEKVRSLIATGVPVNVDYNLGWLGGQPDFLLFTTAVRDHFDMVRLLVDSGAIMSLRVAAL